MRIDYFEQILGRIRKDVHCPRCHRTFGDKEIQIAKVSLEGVELRAKCPRCQSILQITAQVSPQQKSESIPQELSDDSVRGISKTLREFRGRDIRDLFRSQNL